MIAISDDNDVIIVPCECVFSITNLYPLFPKVLKLMAGNKSKYAPSLNYLDGVPIAKPTKTKTSAARGKSE